MIDLANYSLGWGGVDYTSGTAQLSVSINPGTYFVIGGPDGGIGFDLVSLFWLMSLGLMGILVTKRRRLS